VDAILLALGASRRREILGLLRCGERSAGEIYRALGDVTFGAVSQHLRVLERAGLVQVRREGRSRLYLARPEGLGPLREWLESMWDDALAALRARAEAEEAGVRRGRGRPSAEGRRRPRGRGHD
jgi:DNA-binding transcriptional ArsR family regulator